MTNIHTFYMSDSLNVDTYDVVEHAEGTPVQDDVVFFVDWAKKCGGPVLELGSGTGRIAWEIAKAGIEIVGLDLSSAMLTKAESKREDHSDDVNKLISFVQGDMTEFDLSKEFNLIIVPFRGWQVILVPAYQRKSLQSICHHLMDDGYLIIDNFDPRLDMCLPGKSDRSKYDRIVKHPVSDNDVEIRITSHVNDTATQTFTEIWRFTEKDKSGKILKTENERLQLRWTYRWEMQYLFELTGFEVVKLFSDFTGSGPDYGKEQIWVVQKIKD